ncbi:FAD:protein FMN transferase [Alteromonas ponticola]|uniref:FAD:protein FMN transferase n=1 Tax=Alteromonas aquimaris TaxID=2998417 RepID=A0ABT3PA70_9ALTE|nr:FAD:protein FMN transferase [Alteromonas aquimaris]MCW8109671.1 FAD:protein FMN transferase [Alteromonas aquimaris]
MFRQNFVASLWLATLFILVGCSGNTLPVVHLQGKTMGTTYNVKYVVAEQGEINGLQEQIDLRLAQINKLMSTYDPTSELSRFNQNRFTDPVTLSKETSAVIAEALRLGELSNGVLDITVGPLVNLWGFGPNKRPERTPDNETISAVREYVGLDKIKLNGTTLKKLHPMVYVDLSTIAKGYGVDEVVAILEDNGLKNYLVEIGGEMRVSGHRGNGKEWLIAIEKPVSNERNVQRIVSIGEHAIATSGDYRNFYEQDGVRYSHLIDPRTGKPIQHNLVSVTVVDKSSMTADGLATAFNVIGWNEAKALAEEYKLAVYLIRKNAGEFEEYASEEFNRIVEMHD